MKIKCERCGNEVDINKVLDLHYYETIEEFEKRTGETYPDKGLVWLTKENSGGWYPWDKRYYYESKSLYDPKCWRRVIAFPPFPPPDGFILEEKCGDELDD